MSGPVLLRIKLRYDDIDTMIARFAPNVGKAGLFLPTKSVQPIGAEVKFELKLANDTAVIVGLGRVKLAREFDAANPKAACGIGVELMRVTRESREVILKMLERRRALGLVDVAVPTAEDVDGARAKAAAGVEASEPAVPQPIAPALEVSLPVRVPVGSVTGPVSLVRETGAVAVVVPPAVDTVVSAAPDTVIGEPPAPEAEPARARRASGAPAPATTDEPLMTAPRRSSGPIAIAKIAADAGAVTAPIAMLAPEPSRRVRRSLSDLIATATATASTTSRAAGISADMFGAEDEVDVKAVLARARVLAAGADLDAELAALADSAAAPVEISVEAASAELARALGGAAVARDRKPRTAWAPPPPVETSAPIAAPISPPEPVATEPMIEEPPARPKMIDAITMITPVPAEEPAPQKSSAAIVVAALAEPRVETRGSFFDEMTPTPAPAPRPEAQIVDDPAGGDEDADEEVEAIGDADVESEEDAEGTNAVFVPEHEVPPLSPPTETRPIHALAPPARESNLLIDDDVDPSMFDADADFSLDDGPGERTAFGVSPYVEPPIVPEPIGYFETEEAAAARVNAELERAEAALADEDFGFSDPPAEEVDDLEILDEADAEEADPHTAVGGGEDFVHRLELSSEYTPVPEDPLAPHSERPTSVGYTASGTYQLGQHADPLAGFAEEPSSAMGQGAYPSDYDRGFRPHTAVTSARIQPVDHDQHLESALEQLDPDLDELGGPAPYVPAPAPARPARAESLDSAQTGQRRAAPTSGNKHPRAVSEDGVLIDFDDDD